MYYILFKRNLIYLPISFLASVFSQSLNKIFIEITRLKLNLLKILSYIYTKNNEIKSGHGFEKIIIWLVNFKRILNMFNLRIEHEGYSDNDLLFDLEQCFPKWSISTPRGRRWPARGPCQRKRKLGVYEM